MERGCKGREVLIQFSPWGLRKRIVADEPMSEEEWQEVCEILRTDPDRIYLFFG